ncbi:hypothetical protein A0J61_10965, partial [Choanephora cucurbitarum]
THQSCPNNPAFAGSNSNVEEIDTSTLNQYVCNSCGSSTHRRKISKRCPFNESNRHMAARDPTKIPTERDDIGMMNVLCPHCNGPMWIEQRISISSKIRPSFQLCCCSGSAIIESLSATPPILASLLTGRDQQSTEFKQNQPPVLLRKTEGGLPPTPTH